MALIASPTHEVVGIVSDESPFAGLGARGFPVNLGLSIGAYFLLGSSPVWLRKALHLGSLFGETPCRTIVDCVAVGAYHQDVAPASVKAYNWLNTETCVPCFQAIGGVLK